MKLLIPALCLFFLIACDSVPQKNVTAAKAKVSQTRSSYFSAAKVKTSEAKTKFYQSQSVVTKSDVQGLNPDSLYEKHKNTARIRTHRYSQKVYTPEMQ